MKVQLEEEENSKLTLITFNLFFKIFLGHEMFALNI